VGGQNTLTKNGCISVSTGNLAANFSASPASGPAPLTVAFTNQSSGKVIGSAWTFGDGSESSQLNAIHNYELPGIYNVTLVVTDGETTSTKEWWRCVTVSRAASASDLFSDVPPDYWAYSGVMACYDVDLVAGYPDDTYRPALSVSRDQMAVYVSRALAGNDQNVPEGPAEASFADVPIDYWAFKYVEYAVTRNVVKGYSDGTYKPTDEVDRGQMAVFIARAIATPTAGADLVNYTPPATATFPDVPTTFWAYKYVEYIAQPAIGVTKGYPDGDYHPEYVCTRDQMAVYVARAFQLPL
jgi:PKD repeat protein